MLPLEFVRENTQTKFCVWNPVFPEKTNEIKER